MAWNIRAVITLLVFAALAVVPLLAAARDAPFYMDLGRRMMILAIAALSLNLLMGYGGLISFGHAAYVGIGWFTGGICGAGEHTA